MSELRISLESK